jgi:hypothetical protein
MWWKLLIEVLTLIAILAAGGSFWACVKSRGHFRRFLADTSELRRLIDHIGPAKIIEESSEIKPVFGSYAANISTFDRIHFAALRQTAILLLIAVVLMLAISFLLGMYFFIANLAIFLLLSAGEIPASAKNSNATHVHTLISNIYKWNQTDSVACRDYCTQEKSSLNPLYDLLNRIPVSSKL